MCVILLTIIKLKIGLKKGNLLNRFRKFYDYISFKKLTNCISLYKYDVMNKKVILMILDGWGKSPDPKVSAIDNANTPFIDGLYTKYPNAQLRTDGLNVGLPEGQMGNSEVGHMNLGAGRIVYQDLAKLNLAVEHKTMSQEKPLKDAFEYAKKNNKAVHFLGLLSDGGVHSHTSHLRELG